jgi:hypothetical protein
MMELIDVVLKLTGPVQPAGETHTDDKRYENLKTLIELAKDIHRLIDNLAYENAKSDLFSLKRAGKEANDYLDWLGIPEE